MDVELRDLLRISHGLGRDHKLVQGGGGNTSVKTPDGRMYVKASGVTLKDLDEGKGYRAVDLGACLAILEDEALGKLPAAAREAEMTKRLAASCVDELAGRPSVETCLHALLGRCVAHTHPSILGGFLCANGGREATRRLYGEIRPPYLCLEYVDFGYALAARMREEVLAYRRRHGEPPRIVFIENHGLFVSADGAEEALALTQDIVGRASAAWETRRHTESRRKAPQYSAQDRARLEAEVKRELERVYGGIFGERAVVRTKTGGTVADFFEHSGCEELAREGPLTPDAIAYCRGTPVWVSAEERERMGDLAALAVRAREAGGRTPACVLVDGLALFSAGRSTRTAENVEETLEAVLEMLMIASSFGGVRGLSSQAALYVWQSEVVAYRRGLTAREGGKG
ncbi:MAG: class II aldolase/adducin family protein [Planctomycetota bacterium]